jgi:hypothetical protein
MLLKKFILIVLVAHFVNTNLNAQSQFTKSGKIEVINILAKSLLDNYVFADTAKNMKNLLQKKSVAGLYDSIRNPNDFAITLTKDLRSVYNDVHLSECFWKSFAEQGYYYGPVQITGKGYFFDSKDLKQ